VFDKYSAAQHAGRKFRASQTSIFKGTRAVIKGANAAQNSALVRAGKGYN